MTKIEPQAMATEYILHVLDYLDAHTKSAKIALEAYIQHKGVPLTERWKVWVAAPKCLKNTEHDSHIELNGMCFTDDMYEYYRYADNKILDVAEFMYGSMIGKMQEDLDQPDDWFPIGWAELQEDVLKNNKGFLVYD